MEGEDDEGFEQDKREVYENEEEKGQEDSKSSEEESEEETSENQIQTSASSWILPVELH